MKALGPLAWLMIRLQNETDYLELVERDRHDEEA
jgi:hypothetical protein